MSRLEWVDASVSPRVDRHRSIPGKKLTLTVEKTSIVVSICRVTDSFMLVWCLWTLLDILAVLVNAGGMQACALRDLSSSDLLYAFFCKTFVTSPSFSELFSIGIPHGALDGSRISFSVSINKIALLPLMDNKSLQIFFYKTNKNPILFLVCYGGYCALEYCYVDLSGRKYDVRVCPTNYYYGGGGC